MYVASVWNACRAGTLASILCLAVTLPRASAQESPNAHDHQHHDHDAITKKPDAKKKPATKTKKKRVQQTKKPHSHKSGALSGDDGQDAQEHANHNAMKGFLGPYGMNREGSGTSWLPDATPHEGIHARYGDWMLMSHALINGVYDNQGGPRGSEKAFVGGMVMGMAQRQLGEGTLGFRAMLSPEPFMGRTGYPLLFATGETANGSSLLVDRQHPHDLFMELAGTYSYNLAPNVSVFLYGGLPGEPALGPTAFMHRTSGMDIPEAPITHHWLDSTHITFGVVTAGLVLNNWKIEASAFRGREPDQHRFDIEAPRLDSVSARLTWNPVRELSMQVSWGRLNSPEQLHPEVDENRITASATYTQPFGDGNIWSSTFAWGRKINQPGDTLDGFLLESAFVFKNTYTLFGRVERVQEDELVGNPIGLIPVSPMSGMDLHGLTFNVTKVSIGGIYDFLLHDHLKLGVGGLVSKYGIPSDLKPIYGTDPTSYMIFFRLKVS